MLKYCIKFVKGFQECHKHACIQHVLVSELHSIVKPWALRCRGLDLIGEILPTSSKGHKYILVCIDNFTKWVKVAPLINVD